jgi:hypothetical protein
MPARPTAPTFLTWVLLFGVIVFGIFFPPLLFLLPLVFFFHLVCCYGEFSAPGLEAPRFTSRDSRPRSPPA